MANFESETLNECAERRIGRPRCPLAHQKILDAVLQEIKVHGYAGLTIEGVAHEAGVGKATIYRRWNGKDELLLDALMEHACQHLKFRSTGDFPADLRNHLVALIKFLDGELSIAFRSILAAIQTDEDLAEQFRTAWLRRHRDGFASALHEERPEADAKLEYDLVYGPIYARLLFGRPLDEAFVNSLLESRA